MEFEKREEEINELDKFMGFHVIPMSKSWVNKFKIKNGDEAGVFKNLRHIFTDKEKEKPSDGFEAYYCFKMKSNADKFSEIISRNTAEKKYPIGILQFCREHPKSHDRYDMADIYNFKTGVGVFGAEYQEWVRDNIGIPDIKISKVQNSSGEIFSIGDSLESYSRKAIIKEFLINDDEILCRVDKDIRYDSTYNINDVHPKSAEPKFKTEDGYEIVGSLYHTVDKKDFSMGMVSFGEVGNNASAKEYWMFNYKENAEKFAKENKPKYSKKQIEDAVGVIAWTNSLYPDHFLIDKSKLGL